MELLSASFWDVKLDSGTALLCWSREKGYTEGWVLVEAFTVPKGT